MKAVFEVWDDSTGQVRFCFSHSDKTFTTGVMIIQPGTELPKHNRPLAYENLLQLSGKCQMSLLNEAGDVEQKIVLQPSQTLHMEKAQWHIHANPFKEVSLTLFKAEGDITEIIKTLRETFIKVS